MPGEDSPSHYLHLFQILDTGRWDKIETAAQDALRADPTIPFYHYCRGLALTQQNREQEAVPHSEFLLGHEPESAQNHHLAAKVYSGLNKLTKAAKHITTAIGIEPEDSLFYYEAARIAILRMRLDEAKTYIARARQLAPDSPDIALLDIALRRESQAGTANAWKRIEELEEALALDPENARLHDLLGDVYLNELESPKQAERHYRQAVAAEPSNTVFQHDLFNAISLRDPVYRTLSLPPRAFGFLRSLLGFYHSRPWHLIFAIVLGAVPIAYFLIWILCLAIFFWPVAKLYEGLLIRQLRPSSGTSLIQLRAWCTLRRLPLVARILFIPTFAITYWTLLVILLQDYTDPFRNLLLGFAPFTIHFLFVVVAAAYRKLSATTTARG